MKRISWLVTVLIIAFQSCGLDDDQGLCLIGSGVYNDYTIELDPFNEIVLFGPVDLNIVQDEQQQVTINAEPEIFDYISYEVVNQRLEIGIKENLDCFESEEGVMIRVTVPDIESIFALGLSDINAIGNLDLDKLRIDIQGGANIILRGTVEEQIIDVSGEVRLYNFDLLTDITKIIVNGAAEIEVSCESILDIQVTGVATISYKGRPQISRTGTGNINLIDSN